MRKSRAERAILLSISGSGETLPSAVEAACRRVAAHPILEDVPITWSVPHDPRNNSTVETLTIRDIDEVVSAGTDWAPHGILTDAELLAQFQESARARARAGRELAADGKSRRVTVFPWPDVFSRYERLSDRFDTGDREYWLNVHDAGRPLIVRVPDGRSIPAVLVHNVAEGVESIVARAASKVAVRELVKLGRTDGTVVMYIASSLEPTPEEMESAIDVLAGIVEKTARRFASRRLSEIGDRARKTPITDRGPWAPLEPALYTAAHATAARRTAGGRPRTRTRRTAAGPVSGTSAQKKTDDRTFIANMQGTAVLSTGSIDVRFLDGMITGLGSATDEYIVNKPAESYLIYGGRRRKFKTVSAFSFESSDSRGLYVNSRVSGHGISDDGRLELDCVLVDDVASAILDAQITLPNWTPAAGVASARFAELTIARLARGDEVTVTRTLPDESSFGFTVKHADAFTAVTPASRIAVHHAGKTLSFACLGPGDSAFPFVLGTRPRNGMTEVTLVLFGCFHAVATARLSGFRYRTIHAVKLGEFTPEQLATARSAIAGRITASGVPLSET